MKKISWNGVCALPVRLGTLATLLALSLVMSANAVERLFSDPAPAGAAVASDVKVAGVARARTARIDWATMGKAAARPARKGPSLAADQPDILLNAFDDRQIPVVVTRTVSKAADQYVIHGRVPGAAQSHVILSVNKGFVAGSIVVDGEAPVRISYAGGGQYTITETDMATAPTCGADSIAPLDNLPPGTVIPRVAGDNATQIDVMVVYTAAASAAAGGDANMDALSAVGVAEANVIYGNSVVSVLLNLVHSQQISYTESGDASIDLARLQNPSDGYMDDVPTLRATQGADVVILLTESMGSGVAGLAFVQSPVSTGFAGYAYGVVRRDQVGAGTYVFTHEVGHVMGCQHDRANAGSAGAYSYSYGHRYTGTLLQRRTVMAYAPGTRIPFFSNPDVISDGFPTGVIETDPVNGANNAMTINNTAATVAAFAGAATYLNVGTPNVTVAENVGTAKVTLTVVRTGPTTLTTTVSYTTVDVTAVAGVNYSATSGTLTFAPGDTTKTVDVPIINVSTATGDLTFAFNLSGAINGVLGNTTSAAVTITDVDAGVTLAQATASILETAGTVNITINRTGDTSTSSGVEYVTGNGVDPGDALAGTDYTQVLGVAVFDIGETYKIISVPIISRAGVQGNRIFTFGIRNPQDDGNGGPIPSLYGAIDAVVTILEGDSTLALSSATLSVNEATPYAVYTVVRTGVTTLPATVHYATGGGTATPGSEYTTTTGDLTIPAGATSGKISVPILNNSVVNGDHTFVLTLSAPVNSSIFGQTTTLTTILDDDSTFAFPSNAASVWESAGTVTLTVTRTGVATVPVSVSYATSDGTATGGSDYTSTTGTLVFAPGDASKTISVRIFNDALVEGPETFVVTLYSPTGESALGAVHAVTVTIRDDDSLISWSNSSSNYPIVETGGSAVLTVNRTGATGTSNSVAYAVRPGTASIADFTLASGVLIFATNDASKTITIPIINDSLVETNESFTITLATPSSGGQLLGAPTATVTITSDDVGFAFENAVYSGVEDSTVTLKVLRLGYPTGAAHVNWYTLDGDATSGGLDYTAVTSTTLDFADGDLFKNITVDLLDDLTRETNETFRVVLGTPLPVGSSLVSPATATVKILDNDCLVGFASPTLTVSEGVTNALLSVVRVGTTNFSLTVHYATADGSVGVAGTDYTNTTGTLTIAAGATNGIITVPIINQGGVQADRDFTVTLDTVAGSLSGTSVDGALLDGTKHTETVTIQDRETVLALSAGAVNVSEGVTNGAVTITVNRSGSQLEAATVNYYIVTNTPAGGVATSGTDYTPVSGTLTFAAGDTSKTFTVKIINDRDVEGNETFDVKLVSPSANASLGTATETVTIVDDDSQIAWTAGSLVLAPVSEGSSAQVILHRTGATAMSNVVAYVIKPGTASTADYVGTGSTVYWAANDAADKTISIPIVNDGLVESSETFTVVLSTPSLNGSILGTNTVTVTIAANETGLAFGSATYSGPESSTVTLTVNRTGSSVGPVDVNYTTLDGDAKVGTDYTLKRGTLTLGNGVTSGTIPVVLLHNSNLGTNMTFTVELSNPTIGQLLSPSTATVRIIDVDSVVQFSSAAMQVGEGATNAILTVLRTGATNYGVTFHYNVTDGLGVTTNAALVDVDYLATIAGEDVTIAAGATNAVIRVPVVNRSSADSDREFVVTLSSIVDQSPGIAGFGGNNPATVTIKDVSTVGFSSATANVLESAGTLTLTVTRSDGVLNPGTVSYATSASGTATATNDFTVASGTLTFASGETNKSVAIKIVDDVTVEGSETFTVVLSSATGDAVLGTATSTVTILDDDSDISWTPSTATANESDGLVNLTLHRSRGSGNLTVSNSVAYTIKPGSATTADYVGTAGVVSFPAVGALTQDVTLTIPIVQDGLAETNETFTVVLGVPSTGAHISGTATNTVTIVSDEVGFGFSSTNYSSREGTSVTVTVSRSGRATGAATVDYATSDGTALAGLDYFYTSGTLSFADSVLTQTFAVVLAEDAVARTNRAFTVALGNPVGAVVTSPTTATVRIIDNDSFVQFSTNAVTVSEGATNAILTVVRTGSTNFGVQFHYATAAVTAVAATDYTTTSGNLTIAAGATTASISVPLLNRALAQADRTFNVTLSLLVDTDAGGAAAFGATTVETVTITDKSVFDFAFATTNVWENVGSVVLTVVRTGKILDAATVNYATSVAGGASRALTSDYGVTSGTLTFAAGQTNKTISVVITNDAVAEADKNFDVILSSPSVNAALGATITTGTVTILDDDTQIAWVSSAVNANEGGNATLTLRRTGSLSRSNNIPYTIVPGTATAADYTAANGVLVFPLTGSSPQDVTLTIPIINDTLVESNETFSVLLGTPTSGMVLSGTNRAVVTISAEEIGFSFTSATNSGAEGTSVTMTVQRVGNLTGTDSVDYTTADGGALAGSDYTTVSANLSFGPGVASRTFTVALLSDLVVETNETFTVVLSNPSAGTVLSSPTNATIRIIDANSSVAFTTNAVAVSEGATNAVLQVLRTGSTNFALTVSYKTLDGGGSLIQPGADAVIASRVGRASLMSSPVDSRATAANPTDYLTTNGVVTIAAGATNAIIRVPVVNNQIIDGDRFFVVALYDLVNAVNGAAVLGTYSTVDVSVTDNDSIIDFATNAVSVSESAGSTVITLLRSGAVGYPATVAVSTTNGTALAGSDYTARNAVVSFAAGETNKTFSIAIINDTAVEGSETFLVGMGATTGDASIGVTSMVTVTIVDNDAQVGGAVVETGILGVSVTALVYHPKDGIRLEVDGPLGSAIIVERSTDLVNWTEFATAVLAGAPYQVVDLKANQSEHGFYRVRQPTADSASNPGN